MNTRKFDALLALHGETQAELARYLGLSQPALCNKKNGKSEFTQSEISAIRTHYGLSAYEVDDIFFAEEVSN